jgi:hypothetical protein
MSRRVNESRGRGGSRLSTLDSRRERSEPRRERQRALTRAPASPDASPALDFGMTKLQVVYVIIGLVVALTMILAMLPIGR